MPGARKLLGDIHSKPANILRELWRCSRQPGIKSCGTPVRTLQNCSYNVQKLHLKDALPQARQGPGHSTQNMSPARWEGSLCTASTPCPPCSITMSCTAPLFDPRNRDTAGALQFTPLTSIQNQPINDSEIPLLFNTWLVHLLASYHCLLHKHLLMVAQKMGVYY